MFPVFVIADLICILLALPLLFTRRGRWVRRAALLPVIFGLLAVAIGLYAHYVSLFHLSLLALVLVFAAALTSLICVYTAWLLLGIGPKPPTT